MEIRVFFVEKIIKIAIFYLFTSECNNFDSNFKQEYNK